MNPELLHEVVVQSFSSYFGGSIKCATVGQFRLGTLVFTNKIPSLDIVIKD